ncbi:protein ARK2N isoform X1 [Hyperolius riggenbachi]|uniref:protein ARK2N isoform X1 n=1 Tax=Hyperolius riggenbachi TaxID=752182 RepID=UPI0035A2AA1A
MKMEAVGKSEQLLDSEVPPVTQLKVDSPTDEGALDLQSPSLKDGTQDVPDSSGLSSMPCLLKELRRDSSESQLASTESDKPSTGRVYESDSSNHCMLSPSSSGHLADSDTLSSAEENQTRRPEAISEGCEAAAQGSAVARKSRRSRSESETSTMAAKKNRQSSDKQNGRVTKVKGHRSQKHKERIRLLRQKREAAARKKYNLLQDSSTSDSDLTCDSSTSSSDDDEEVSGSSKTITAEIPDRASSSLDIWLLIQAVEEHPELYDPAVPAYRDLHKTKRSWRRIGKIVTPEWKSLIHRQRDEQVQVIQSLWKSLRDGFKKDHLQILQKSGSKSKEKKARPSFHQLEFLRPALEMEQTSGSEEEESVESTTLSVEEEEPLNGMAVAEEEPLNGMAVAEEPLNGMAVAEEEPLNGMAVAEEEPLNGMAVAEEELPNGMAVAREEPNGMAVAGEEPNSVGIVQEVLPVGATAQGASDDTSISRTRTPLPAPQTAQNCHRKQELDNLIEELRRILEAREEENAVTSNIMGFLLSLNGDMQLVPPESIPRVKLEILQVINNAIYSPLVQPEPPKPVTYAQALSAAGILPLEEFPPLPPPGEEPDDSPCCSGWTPEQCTDVSSSCLPLWRNPGTPSTDSSY